MTPTPHLRFVLRTEPVAGNPHLAREVRVLQQLWRAHHIPAGQTQAPEEWRDVPMTKEEKK